MKHLGRKHAESIEIVGRSKSAFSQTRVYGESMAPPPVFNYFAFLPNEIALLFCILTVTVFIIADTILSIIQSSQEGQGMTIGTGLFK